ncbi:MAG: VWA domain-containing protein [Vicinamibacterales bacterium]
MRVAHAALAAAAGTLLGAAVVRAQEPAPPQPVFRTGVEALTIDVTALDDQGRQVTDLAPDEFTIEVNGRPSPLQAATYVPLVRQAPARRAPAGGSRVRPALQTPADTPYFSSNTGPELPGRQVLLIVDQGNIRLGGGRRATERAQRFVDRLQPDDRVAVALIPAPGAILDFTTDHDRVRETLLGAIGTATPVQGRFRLSVSEARAIDRHTDVRIAFEALARECGAALPLLDAEQCEREVREDAAATVAEVRQQAELSMHAIRALIDGLARMEGSKQVILISEGLVLDDLGGSVAELATAASDARASIDVLLLESPAMDASVSARPTTPREDRLLREEGLEMLAGLSRGAFYRVATDPAPAFARILRALDGYYLLAVTPPSARAGDERYTISVRTSRPGVVLRTRPSVPAPVTAGARTSTDAVTRILRYPVPARELPMRLATWTVRDTPSRRQRVLVAVEADWDADQPLEFVTGLLLVNREGRGFAPEVASRTLTPSAVPGRAVYRTNLLVEPGSYRLRVAAADARGRLGTVERTLDVFQAAPDDVVTSDLLLGRVPAEASAALQPAIAPVAADGRLMAIIEAYLPAGVAPAAVSAHVEVARSPESPAIVRVPLDLAGPASSTAHLQAVLDLAALPPGLYLARAAVFVDGAPVGDGTRPFEVGASAGTNVLSSIPEALAAAVVETLPAFDSGELFAPAFTRMVLAEARGHGASVADALAEAEAGDFDGAAVSALMAGDQGLAALLKGVALLRDGNADRAALQLQNAMAQAPDLVSARAYLGATFAAAGRHGDAAGLFQSGATDDARTLRVAWPRKSGCAPASSSAPQR